MNIPKSEIPATREGFCEALARLELAEMDPPAQLVAITEICRMGVPVLKKAGVRLPLPDEEALINAMMRVGMGIPTDRPLTDQEILLILQVLAQNLAVAERLACD